MSPLDTKTLNDAIELLKAAKVLLGEQNPYLPLYSALGGAFIGALASIIPTTITNWMRDRKETRSTTLQIYADVKASLDIVKHRTYIEDLEKIVQAFERKDITVFAFHILVQDELFRVYKNALPKLGQLDASLQVKIVRFYQLIEAVIQDVRPGGILNANGGAGAEAYNEVLHIAKLARKVGEDIIADVERLYPECCELSAS